MLRPVVLHSVEDAPIFPGCSQDRLLRRGENDRFVPGPLHIVEHSKRHDQLGRLARRRISVFGRMFKALRLDAESIGSGEETQVGPSIAQRLPRKLPGSAWPKVS